MFNNTEEMASRPYLKKEKAFLPLLSVLIGFMNRSLKMPTR